MVGISLANLVKKKNNTCLLKHEMALSTDGTESVCGENAFYTPFIYTLFYIIYTFGYFTLTVYTHYLPCVLIIIIILCVSYDSIHVLNVFVLSRANLLCIISKSISVVI